MILNEWSFDALYPHLIKSIIQCDNFSYRGTHYCDELMEVESHGRKFLDFPHCTFILYDPTKNTVSSQERKFKLDFAEKFFEWIWNGESDITKLIPLNENAKNYADDNAGRNTAYGPRIKEQIDAVLTEISLDKESRRTTIMVLYPTDLEMLDDMREGKTKAEFPCTIAVQPMIRNNQLNMHVFMRSNNAVTTLLYDVFNFTKLQMKIWEILKATYSDLRLGYYYHTAASMHVYVDELPLAEKILEEYAEKLFKDL